MRSIAYVRNSLLYFLASLKRNRHFAQFIRATASDTIAVCYLIIENLDLVQKRLRAQLLEIVLFERKALVVKTLEVEFLVLLPPDAIESLLRFPPLFIFRFQSAKVREAGWSADGR